MRPAIALPPFAEGLIRDGRTWWEARAPREQALLLCLAAILVLAVAIGGFVKPLQAVRAEARSDIRLYDSLAVRLRAAGPELNAEATRAARTGSVQAIVSTTAGELALEIRQIEQRGAVTNVTLSAVEFTRLMRWLDRLDREAGITVTSARIERQTLPGVVNARLSLVRQ
jgi:general secretion pathway protein M